MSVKNINKSRLEIIHGLDDLLEKAYSSIPCDEYYALLVAKQYIRTRYDLDDLQNFCMNFAADHKMQDMSGELPNEE